MKPFPTKPQSEWTLQDWTDAVYAMTGVYFTDWPPLPWPK